MTYVAGVPTILVAQGGARCEDLVRSFQQLGYLVLRASDAAEAIEVARTHSRSIHIMIADDSVDSRSLAATLKQYRPQMRVLFLAQFAPADRPDLATVEIALARVRELLNPFLLAPGTVEQNSRTRAGTA